MISFLLLIITGMLFTLSVVVITENPGNMIVWIVSVIFFCSGLIMYETSRSLA